MSESVLNATSSRTSTSPTVAVIGMEGAGKTVLVTTLAKKLSVIDSRGVFLDPQDRRTLNYVERVWGILQSGDWPPSTPPGEKCELRWKLRIVDKLESSLRLIDMAGQDLRRVFGGDQIEPEDSLPMHLQALCKYCREADILLLVLNLKHFIGESDADRRADNQWALKSAMDYLESSERRPRVCLVLTQWDEYQHLAKEQGGWRELLKACVPYVFSHCVAGNNRVAYRVSAVSETRVVTDGEGVPRRVPFPSFRSAGLDGLVKWMTTQVVEVKQELENRSKAAPQEDGSHIVFRCQQCGQKLRLPKTEKRLEVTCPSCQHRFSYQGGAATPCKAPPSTEPPRPVQPVDTFDVKKPAETNFFERFMVVVMVVIFALAAGAFRGCSKGANSSTAPWQRSSSSSGTIHDWSDEARFAIDHRPCTRGWPSKLGQMPTIVHCPSVPSL